MGLFGFGKKKDEYDEIYGDDIFDNGDDDGIDYSELDQYEFEEDVDNIINKMRGTIQEGDCLYCNAKNAMKYDGSICFICSKCNWSAHEDVYYTWVAGYLKN